MVFLQAEEADLQMGRRVALNRRRRLLLQTVPLELLVEVDFPLLLLQTCPVRRDCRYLASSYFRLVLFQYFRFRYL